ncbi:helix-turn-helix transcriptional regulator [Algihabitans albus]|uniref:helix-turn-helix transcriptional regulator n=1 Tax=Algihabitans albus TaxID=2164067 RepID=UPI000E5D4190|nr:helix-turn-helix transcriptional regulator [Algihabitans albus]
MAERPPELMTTREVADYLRIKERRLYELVRRREIPCTRVTGKWLFPKPLIDLWLARNLEGAEVPIAPPPVIAGSADPLLDWAVRESACGLALMPGGSLDGVKRFVDGGALVAGLHVYDPERADWNVTVIEAACVGRPVVLVEWARRSQGLIVAADNPLGVSAVADLGRDGLRWVARQAEAGAQLLLAHLLGEAGRDIATLTPAETVLSELEVGLAVLEGRADAGLAVEAVARSLKLGFVPLMEERYDLLVARRAYFEPPLQTLLAFTRTAAFARRAESMGGYDIASLGRVRFNGP